jgi:hypothetical protein
MATPQPVGSYTCEAGFGDQEWVKKNRTKRQFQLTFLCAVSYEPE